MIKVTSFFVMGHKVSNRQLRVFLAILLAFKQNDSGAPHRSAAYSCLYTGFHLLFFSFLTVCAAYGQFTELNLGEIKSLKIT